MASGIARYLSETNTIRMRVDALQQTPSNAHTVRNDLVKLFTQVFKWIQSNEIQKDSSTIKVPFTVMTQLKTKLAAMNRTINDIINNNTAAAKTAAASTPSEESVLQGEKFHLKQASTFISACLKNGDPNQQQKLLESFFYHAKRVNIKLLANPFLLGLITPLQQLFSSLSIRSLKECTLLNQLILFRDLLRNTAGVDTTVLKLFEETADRLNSQMEKLFPEFCHLMEECIINNKKISVEFELLPDALVHKMAVDWLPGFLKNKFLKEKLYNSQSIQVEHELLNNLFEAIAAKLKVFKDIYEKNIHFMGMNFLIRHLQHKKKLEHVKMTCVESPEALKEAFAVLDYTKDSQAEILYAMYSPQLHYLPIHIRIKNQHATIIITNSCDPRKEYQKDFFKILDNVTDPEKMKQTDIHFINTNRQRDLFTCGIFSLLDAFAFIKKPALFDFYINFEKASLQEKAKTAAPMLLAHSHQWMESVQLQIATHEANAKTDAQELNKLKDKLKKHTTHPRGQEFNSYTPHRYYKYVAFLFMTILSNKEEVLKAQKQA